MIVPTEEVKFIFDTRKLKPGDVLLMNTYEEQLRSRMKCKYEHVAIYIGDAQIVEANGAHVVMTHVYSYAFREEEHACVLRPKNVSPITLDNITRNARKQIGREYVDTIQFRYVRAFKNTDRKDETNRSFCSRLVAQAYRDENVQLLPNADYCEPDDFLQSELLEVVPDGVMPIIEELVKVVESQQIEREKTGVESPSSEMFEALSSLYNADIQDLGQALMEANRHPELSDDAIKVIKESPMFKHLDDVNRTMPWFWNDNDFLNHFNDDEKALHFIYSQLNHYDNTILKDYSELHLQFITLAYYRPDFKVAVFLRDYISKMVDEAIDCRKRLENLYELMQNERSESFQHFVNKYGQYNDYKYEPMTIDISFILNDIMKAMIKDN